MNPFPQSSIHLRLLLVPVVVVVVVAVVVAVAVVESSTCCLSSNVTTTTTEATTEATTYSSSLRPSGGIGVRSNSDINNVRIRSVPWILPKQAKETDEDDDRDYVVDKDDSDQAIDNNSDDYVRHEIEEEEAAAAAVAATATATATASQLDVVNALPRRHVLLNARGGGAAAGGAAAGGDFYDGKEGGWRHDDDDNSDSDSAIITTASSSSSSSRRRRSHGFLHFHVMGDTPYVPREVSLLPIQLAALPSHSEFVVHVGDLKKRGPHCVMEDYHLVVALLDEIPKPTFLLPGDNDWLECSDGHDAYRMWRDATEPLRTEKTTTMMTKTTPAESSDPLGDDDARMIISYQESRPENFAFLVKGVLVIGLHVLRGGYSENPVLDDVANDNVRWFRTQIDARNVVRVPPPAENAHDEEGDGDGDGEDEDDHIADDVEAIVILAHAFPIHPTNAPLLHLLRETAAIMPEIPFMYIQGDLHTFQLDRPFPSLPNFQRAVVDRGGNADPLEVVVDTRSEVPFKLKRRPLTTVSTTLTVNAKHGRGGRRGRR